MSEIRAWGGGRVVGRIDTECMTAPELMRVSSQLLAFALTKLDVSEGVKCACCGMKKHRSWEQSRAFKSLEETPRKIEQMAQKVRAEIEEQERAKR